MPADAFIPQQTGQIIPPGSRVLVRLAAVRPDCNGSGNACPPQGSDVLPPERLRCVLQVLSPSFYGRTFIHHMTLCGAPSDRRQIRALIEAACRIRPADNSPRAIQARILHAWSDLEGLEFPIVTGVAWLPGSDGRIRPGNTLEAVISMDEPDYARLREGGEWISRAPVPAAAQPNTPAPVAAQAGAPSAAPGLASRARIVPPASAAVPQAETPCPCPAFSAAWRSAAGQSAAHSPLSVAARLVWRTAGGRFAGRAAAVAAFAEGVAANSLPPCLTA